MQKLALREFAKMVIPPILLKVLLRLGMGGNRFKYGFENWDAALKLCSGYDSAQITEVTLDASRKVRDGVAAFERDGVIFDSVQHSWQLLSSILGTPRSGSSLKVLDWGGSFGSTYRQNKGLIEAAGIDLTWVVVEQKHLAEIGTTEFQTENLLFASDLEELTQGDYDLVILASSICYVRDPEKILSQILRLKPAAIAFDRTPVTSHSTSDIGIQSVSSSIYRSSYPIRAFAADFLENSLSSEFTKVSEWICELQPDPKTVSKGFFFISNGLLS